MTFLPSTINVFVLAPPLNWRVGENQVACHPLLGVCTLLDVCYV